LFGEIPPRIKIEENGCSFWADLAAGPKKPVSFSINGRTGGSGWILPGKKCAGLFAATPGHLGINAFNGRAKKVEWVDSFRWRLKNWLKKMPSLRDRRASFNGVVVDSFDYLASLKSREI